MYKIRKHDNRNKQMNHVSLSDKLILVYKGIPDQRERIIPA